MGMDELVALDRDTLISKGVDEFLVTELRTDGLGADLVKEA